MAVNKFENNIKDKLEKRTLKPSADAWSKLYSRLENQEEKPSNKSFWWLGIAASIIGVLLVVTQVFKNEPLEHLTPQIVVTPEVVTPDETHTTANINVKNIEEASEEIKIKEAKKSNQIKKKSTVIIPNLTKESILIAKEKAITTIKKGNAAESVKIVSENSAFQKHKIQEIIAQANTLKNNENQVAESEIETLLTQAQKDITLKRLNNENTKKIDALVLLQDVEDELDQSFREKVFKALKENFITVKTAVAQRND
ncbi:hypothetical protein [Gelatiniphilus marinus]|uniref:Anti-sigma factor n=1 Tax=Gelatiniphilus marinus TaxID=1759464 RepID=A0ABW5JRV7_9FLAO